MPVTLAVAAQTELQLSMEHAVPSDTIPADASPEKWLFISLLTRDISLGAAFLDLIDNSVNAAVQPLAERLETADDYLAVLDDDSVQPAVDIDVEISNGSISITDTAPGIPLETARDHVFRFGRGVTNIDDTDRLSVYGLGLKRAFFKAGKHVTIESDHVRGGFGLDLDVDEWSRDETPRWQFDLVPREPARAHHCGTRIVISDLYDETHRRLHDGVFVHDLGEQIGRTYAYFLEKFVRISVNGRAVTATNLRVGENTATDRFSDDEVTCTITAGLGTPEGGVYRDQGSGWFIFCNGRTVVSADKTPLTGWQSNGLPIFQPKHRPFLGTVFFVSKFADRLPWDTTKSGINEDSSIWQQAMPRMVTVGRSVTSFLDSRYTDEGTEVEHADLQVAGGDRIDIVHASLGGSRPFVQPTRPTRTTTRIQYSAKREDIRAIAEYLSQPSMSGSQVGRHTFNFFLRNEVGEL